MKSFSSVLSRGRAVSRVPVNQVRGFSQQAMPYAYRSGPSYAEENPRRSDVVYRAVQTGLLAPTRPAVEFFDLDLFEDHCQAVQNAPFPDGTLHTIACKAQPVAKILRTAQRNGLGCETASCPELTHALRCGFAAPTVVFDSPSKTRHELAMALETGVWINADNFQELEAIDEVIRTLSADVKRTIGLRVNVQSFSGAITSTNSITSTPTSKFGEGIVDNRGAVLEAYMKYPWLNAIHCHCGSQGVDVDFLVKGATDVMKMVDEINASRGGDNPVCNIDIGGGLETDYSGKGATIKRFSEYATKLKVALPQLWSPPYKVTTEFGRALTAVSGFAVSRVEYTKNSGGRKIATTHLGADYHVRAAYLPGLWMPSVSVYNKSGKFQDGKDGLVPTDVAGPLCFTGDLMVKGQDLPSFDKGDHVMINDTGAYTSAMWSRYNSRQAPPMIGVSTRDVCEAEVEGSLEQLLSGEGNLQHSGYKFSLLKKGETVDDVLRFWD